MLSSPRLIGFVALSLASSLAACASVTTRSYVAPGAPSVPSRTFNWAPADTWSTGDPRLDNNRFFQERVQAAVEQQLAARGYTKAVSPALIVHYHASVTQDIYVAERIGDAGEDNSKPEMYERGTLVIDLVDAGTARLVWRGWAEGSIDGAINNQALMERRIDDAVARITKELPEAF
jgi:hypothetical protein